MSNPGEAAGVLTTETLKPTERDGWEVDMARKRATSGVPNPQELGSSRKARGSDRARTPSKAETAAQETDDDLEDALEQTFPASDPISFQSTLVPGRHR
jgi:hypothetical protein